MSRESETALFKALTHVAAGTPRLGATEEAVLAREAQAGSQVAFECLLNAHLRLVLSIAYELRKYGLPMEELVSEGLLGLVEAARRFDPERGTRLATYAARWIRASMRRYTLAHRRIVRLPSTRDGRKLIANLRRAQHQLAQASGREPDAQAIADVLRVGVRDVEEIEAALSARDVPYGPEGDGRAVELPSEGESAENLLGDAEQRERAGRSLEAALSALSTREQHILKERHLASPKTSLAAIARGIGVSRERVRQIEERARDKVKNTMISS